MGLVRQCVAVLLGVLVAGSIGACDSLSSGGSSDGPSTTCLYGYTPAEGATEDFGQACTSDDECGYGVCMKPGDSGNITNAVFGFCTRACDCDCAASDPDCSQSVSGSDPNWSCVYPGGCFPGSKGQYRYVMPKCSSVQDCQDIDPRYTHCAKTYLENALNDPNKLCGQEAKVCQAFN